MEGESSNQIATLLKLPVKLNEF